MMGLLYRFFIFSYSLIVRVAAVFNPKARLWIAGRKNILSEIKKNVNPGGRIVWVHCASLGEFEQGRPLIERIKTQYPDVKIFLTFFSPSGYEVRKKYDLADWVYYLPVDTVFNATTLVSHLKPNLVFFVKYEFWYNYLDQLYRRHIPVIFLSVIFRPSQHFFSWYGGWFRQQLQKVTMFFVQDENSAELLSVAGIHHAEVAGDTRMDRVVSLAQNPEAFEAVARFKSANILLVGGSTWPVDEQLLLATLRSAAPEVKILLAPHLVDAEHVQALVKQFAEFHPVLYTRLPEIIPSACRVLVVDTIGMLSQLYQYADLAYIGGGFGVGIHNLPEAAVFGVPVVHGPNYNKFKEAVDLRDLGGGFPVTSEKEGVDTLLHLLENRQKREDSGVIAQNYIRKNAGATDLIMEKVTAYLGPATRHII